MRVVLVVDDQQSILQTLEFVLSTHGYRTLLASSGSAALEIAARESIDAALLDLNMPEMDGVTLCQALRRLFPSVSAAPPIWIMSAAHTTDAEARAREAGAVALLRKPFDYHDLFAELSDKIGRAKPEFRW